MENKTTIYVDPVQYKIHRASGTLDKLKSDLVGELLGKRYTLFDEIGLIRQKETKPEKYAVYNAYADACVEAVNAEFARREAEVSR